MSNHTYLATSTKQFLNYTAPPVGNNYPNIATKVLAIEMENSGRHQQLQKNQLFLGYTIYPNAHVILPTHELKRSLVYAPWIRLELLRLWSTSKKLMERLFWMKSSIRYYSFKTVEIRRRIYL